MKRQLVLIAHDEPDAVRVYTALFQSRGLAVAVAAGGEAGLFKAMELRPDLLVLDAGEQPMDRVQVLRRLRTSGVPPIPVLVITAAPLAEIAAAARGAGADEVMSRSASPVELCARVARLLGLEPATTGDTEAVDVRSGAA